MLLYHNTRITPIYALLAFTVEIREYNALIIAIPRYKELGQLIINLIIECTKLNEGKGGTMERGGGV